MTATVSWANLCSATEYILAARAAARCSSLTIDELVALTNGHPLHSIPTPGTILSSKGLPFRLPRLIGWSELMSLSLDDVLGHTRSLGQGSTLRFGFSTICRVHAVERSNRDTITVSPPFSWYRNETHPC